MQMINDGQVAEKRILLVEDDPDICKVVSFRLKQAGYHVDIAHSGEEGLREAREHVPDLIILDLMLPSLPGEEVCKSLREDDRIDLQQVPIIMLTAKSREADRIVGKVIGANSYLIKPFEVQELLYEVSCVIKDR